MSLPTMTGTARLIDNPELRFAAGSGKAVVKVRLAFNARKKDPTSGDWVDGDSFFIDGTAFEQAAENIASSLEKGMEVIVSGRLRTERWETKQQEKRSAPALLIDSIGPSLRSATAVVSKAGSGSGRQEFQQARQSAGSGDPWTSASQQAGQGGGGSWGSGEEPPF
ncbi:single-stranded DNA-binding protein [Streptomyces rectiviolaceus]|uniref:Single-stranded DNA-binding protein n=1 Tax=Streptomyces rectiviolaceus TaxID=332591 RepID=A0ABP6NNG3_9ACTN